MATAWPGGSGRAEPGSAALARLSARGSPGLCSRTIPSGRARSATRRTPRALDLVNACRCCLGRRISIAAWLVTDEPVWPPRRDERLQETVRARLRRGAKLVFVLIAFSIAIPGSALADHKRVFMAPDDHTDYFWSATGDQYAVAFTEMLDYYLDQAEATKNEPPNLQSRFSADGSLWLWEYAKKKDPADFQRLVDALKSGHISAPLNPLVITYGGVPAEAVIRSMYYPGQLERRHGLDFPLAIAMENAGMSHGLGSVWAGAGAEYSWKGVCDCPSLIPILQNRTREIYNWIGPDGSRILMKWNSLHNQNDNESIGGYAEARKPAAVLDLVTHERGRERVRGALPVQHDRRLRPGLGRSLDEEPADPADVQGEHRPQPDLHRLELDRLLPGVRLALRTADPLRVGELRQRVGSHAGIDGRGLGPRQALARGASLRRGARDPRRTARPLVPRRPRRRARPGISQLRPLLRARLRERRAPGLRADPDRLAATGRRPRSRPTRTTLPPTRRARSER